MSQILTKQDFNSWQTQLASEWDEEKLKTLMILLTVDKVGGAFANNFCWTGDVFSTIFENWHDFNNALLPAIGNDYFGAVLVKRDIDLRGSLEDIFSQWDSFTSLFGDIDNKRIAEKAFVGLKQVLRHEVPLDYSAYFRAVTKVLIIGRNAKNETLVRKALLALEGVLERDGLDDYAYFYAASAIKAINNHRPGLIQEHTLASLVIQLPERVTNHTLVCWRVYGNQHFQEVTQSFSEVQQYSIALAAHCLLQQHGLDTQDEDNINMGVDIIMQERSRPGLLKREPFAKGRHIVNILHEQERFKSEDAEELEKRSGAQKRDISLAYQGPKKKDAALQDIE